MTLRRSRSTPRRRDAPRWSADEWASANLTLYSRAGGRCWWCGKPLLGSGVRHHRQRRRDGGDRLSNLVLLHSYCHNVAPGSVHQEPAKATERGFIVPSWGDPLLVPILLERGAHLLDDDGGLRVHSDLG